MENFTFRDLIDDTDDLEELDEFDTEHTQAKYVVLATCIDSSGEELVTYELEEWGDAELAVNKCKLKSTDDLDRFGYVIPQSTHHIDFEVETNVVGDTNEIYDYCGTIYRNTIVYKR